MPGAVPPQAWFGTAGASFTTLRKFNVAEAFASHLLLIIARTPLMAALSGVFPVVDSVFAKESSPSLVSYCPPAALARGSTRLRFRPGSAAALARERAPFQSVESLVAGFRHLCRRGARKFWRSGLERCDLEQVAAIGLIKAAQRYDSAVGTPFEAYAWLFVVGELMHYVRDFERTIRLPRRLVNLERRYARAHESFSGRLAANRPTMNSPQSWTSSRRRSRKLRAAREAACTGALEEAGADALPALDALAFEDKIMVRRRLRRAVARPNAA